jgi:transposase-like protein
VVSGAFRLEPAVTQPIERDAIYRRRRFPRDVIETCVRWYLTYRLSYRDLVALMAERDVHLTHTTIMRWVLRFVPEYEKRWNRRAKPVGSSWRVDETFIHTRPKMGYLYRAVDEDGKTVDSLFQIGRGIAAAMAFFPKALASCAPRWPRKITLDGHRPSHSGLRRLRREDYLPSRVLKRGSRSVIHCSRDTTGWFVFMSGSRLIDTGYPARCQTRSNKTVVIRLAQGATDRGCMIARMHFASRSPLSQDAALGKDLAEHIRTVHFSLIAVCAGLLVLALSARAYNARIASSQLAAILAMQHYGLNALYHAVATRFPEDSDDPPDYQPTWSARQNLEVDVLLADPITSDFHSVLSLATTLGTRRLLLTFPQRDWYQTVSGPPVDPEHFPETIGAFRRWWDSLRTANETALDLTFATYVPYNALLYNPATYRETVGGDKPTPDAVRAEFEQASEQRARHHPYNPDVLYLGAPTSFDRLVPPSDRVSLVFDYTSYGGGFVGSVPDSGSYLYIPVVSSLRVAFSQRKLLRAMATIADVEVPWIVCPGSFEDSFPDLAKATQDLDALPLSEAEKSLIDEASLTVDSFEALGVKFPADQVTRWGVALIIGIQLYLFLCFRGFQGLLGPQGMWKTAWMGLDRSAIARVILFATVVVLPIATVALLTKLAIAQALVAELHEERLALARISRDSCSATITWHTATAAMRSPTAGYGVSFVLACVLGIVTWTARPKPS